MHRLAFIAIGLPFWLAAQDTTVDVSVTGHVLRAGRVEATAQRIQALKLPPGFRIARFAEGLGKPRMLAVAPDGAVYVTRREPGDCLVLKDTDGDGRADDKQVAARQPGLHGIALHGDQLFFATVKEVFTAPRNPDGTAGELRKLIGDLPDGGQHPNRTLAVGPDKMLYITVGSTCNACPETNPENAAMLRAKLDGSAREIFASGLRNTLGFGWHPDTGQLWALDHGTDWLGDRQPPEELNQIVQGGQYGWPYVHGDGQINPGVQDPPGGVTKQEWARKSRAPALEYTAHAAPMQMAFHTADRFPAEYRNDAFAAMHGSWNRKPPSGFEVVRIRFQNGKPAAIEPFLTGFLVQQGDDWVHFGRPAGLAVARDGSLLFSDDANGVIYRVWYEGGGKQISNGSSHPAPKE